MRVIVEALTPRLCCVTAKPSWLERLFGVRGYTERFAARTSRGGWIWDGPPKPVELHIEIAIERELRRLRWVTRSTAPPS